MKIKNIKRDTYKYYFKIGNLTVHCGKTINLHDRELKHKNSKRYHIYNNKRHYWKDGHIVKVGNITTKKAAYEWELQNNCNENWN